jgi:hypothetical protein
LNSLGSPEISSTTVVLQKLFEEFEDIFREELSDVYLKDQKGKSFAERTYLSKHIPSGAPVLKKTMNGAVR